MFETNGTKKNLKENGPSSETAFSQRFVKLFPAQLSGIPKWLFTINSSDLFHWSLNETYAVVTVSKMVRSELLIKVCLCPWRPASVLCTCILSLVTKFTHICNLFVIGNEQIVTGKLNLWPLKFSIKYSDYEQVYLTELITIHINSPWTCPNTTLCSPLATTQKKSISSQIHTALMSLHPFFHSVARKK